MTVYLTMDTVGAAISRPHGRPLVARPQLHSNCGISAGNQIMIAFGDVILFAKSPGGW
jgi:hypothetical protein